MQPGSKPTTAGGKPGGPPSAATSTSGSPISALGAKPKVGAPTASTDKPKEPGAGTENKDEGPKFVAFGGKGYSLK